MMKLMQNVTFIWKYEDEDDIEIRKNIPSNVHFMTWLPQPALLGTWTIIYVIHCHFFPADSRLSLFVTHGGLGSVMEVAHSGIPAIVIPLFFDQPMNGEMLKRHGGAEVYSKFDLKDSQKLSGVVKKMLNSDYSRNAKRLSNLLQKQPIDPTDRLIKHAEFAAEFKSLPELDPYSRQLNFAQYFFLDIIVLVIVCIFIMLRLLKLTIHFVRSSMRVKSKYE